MALSFNANCKFRRLTKLRCLFQAGKGSATLSMAYAAAAFAESCLKAMAGQSGIEECAYVQVSCDLRLSQVCL